MFITNKSDYAIKALKYLASLPKGKYATIRVVAEAESLPPAFLAKILTELYHARILESVHGRGGGFRLAVSPKRLSFLKVVELMEGPLHISVCTTRGKCSCTKRDHCQLRSFWNSQEESIKDTLVIRPLIYISETEFGRSEL